ncbi:uncharacterized protein LOC126736363 [Anthonomus grandis grandis]|uniref:uncharacterized protein LOC126736363 n=1 Tax=Anthonomus grandis grandis TaxID=2921223 RepID=UPI002166ACCE|nr:uncharacterized protein LOC126736363 [Anthonomus grandis grandis]
MLITRYDPDAKRYHYFDTPDGEDLPQKLWCVMRPTIMAASAIGMCDILLWSHPKGYTATALRFAAVSLPIVGIAGTFVLATNTIASIRKKDERKNWFLGGFIAGSCIGMLKRRAITGFNMGMAGGIIAFAIKETKRNGWEVMPSHTKMRKGGAFTCLGDYSLTAERPKNWTTCESSE